MNMDFYGYFVYGDADAVKQFALAHYFAHDAEANAIATQFGRSITTYNASGLSAVDSWIALMEREIEEQPRDINDWLEAHNENHQAVLSILGGGIQTINGVADLSLVDFRDETAMYDWLTLHQQIHQFEQQALGLS